MKITKMISPEIEFDFVAMSASSEAENIAKESNEEPLDFENDFEFEGDER